MEVTDTGEGIDEKHLRRIFKPFFTTKSKGTGLGLSLAKRVVEEHGGVIRVQTEVGKGTTFRIILPQRLEPPKVAEVITFPGPGQAVSRP